MYSSIICRLHHLPLYSILYSHRENNLSN